MLIRVVAINARYTHSNPAIFYIREELQDRLADVQVDLRQCTINDPYHELVLRLSEDEPDYLFFSALIWNSDIIEKLIGDLLLFCEETHIVVGGPQAQVLAAHFADHPRFSWVKGEIEAIGHTDFYTHLAAKKMERMYSGSFLQLPKKKMRFPFQQQDFTDMLQNRQVYYESSRGCPFSCSYCLSSAEKGVFHKPVDQVCQEIDFLLANGARVIRFVDRTFNDNKHRALAIWKILAAKTEEVLFHFEVSPDRFDDEMLDFLCTVPVGKFQFELGIQSTNAETLIEINRKVDLEKARKNIPQLVEGENIHIHADLILGLPCETVETFKRSFEELFYMKPHYIQMGLLKILPDTEIWKKREEYGYRASSVPPYSIYASKWMNSRQVADLYWFGECIEKFLNTKYFVSLWDYLRQIQEPVTVFFENLLRICQQKRFFQLSPTHDLMGSCLLEACRSRDDFHLIREMITYDWFRLGHRFLAKFLAADGVFYDFQSIKKKLYLEMEDEIAGVYEQKGKSQFFKKSLFIPLSGITLRTICNAECEDEVIVCFMQQKEDHVHQLARTIIL